jgi:hypothetical protein
VDVAPEIDQVLQEGRQAHVAIVSERGPHVTPELYAWAEGRLWFWFARTTLKAKVLATRPQAAVLVSAGGRSALLVGDVDLMDPGRPSTLLGTPRRALRATRAIGGYAVRNAPDLGAFVRDLGTGRLGWRPPPARVLASLEPRRSAVILDGRVTASDGFELRTRDRGPEDGSRTGGEQVVAGLPGPGVAPASWFADEAELWMDPALLDSFGVEGQTSIAIVADEYVAPGPAAKVGTLARGSARRPRGRGMLKVDIDTLTSWEGIETDTHQSHERRAARRA